MCSDLLKVLDEVGSSDVQAQLKSWLSKAKAEPGFLAGFSKLMAWLDNKESHERQAQALAFACIHQWVTRSCTWQFDSSLLINNNVFFLYDNRSILAVNWHVSLKDNKMRHDNDVFCNNWLTDDQIAVDPHQHDIFCSAELVAMAHGASTLDNVNESNGWSRRWKYRAGGDEPMAQAALNTKLGLPLEIQVHLWASSSLSCLKDGSKFLPPLRCNTTDRMHLSSSAMWGRVCHWFSRSPWYQQLHPHFRYHLIDYSQLGQSSSSYYLSLCLVWYWIQTVYPMSDIVNIMVSPPL